MATYTGILIFGQWEGSAVLLVMGLQQALHTVTKPAPTVMDVLPGRGFLLQSIPTNPSGSPRKDEPR